MKKFLALLLAVLMIAGMSVTAFATSVDSGDIKDEAGNAGSQSADVKINITGEDGKPLEPTVIYRVVVAWKDLEFKVTATEAVWEADEQHYKLTDGKLVEDQFGTLTITNHSNAPVTINAAFDGAEDGTPLVSKVTGGITATMALTEGELTGGKLVVDSAEGYGDNPPYIVYTVTPSGTPQNVPDLAYTVDKISITIEK